MKKSLIVTLALVFVLGIAGTAFAANPFTDVPANHWAYASISKLAQAGIIDGYGDGKYVGNSNMTRYEMAQIVAKAMANVDSADSAQKAQIEKLAAEFADELDSLGVRVAKLEKNADNVKITGEARFSWYDFENGTSNSGNGREELRTRLWLSGQVNDRWSYNAMLENKQDLRTNGRAGDESKTSFRRAWVEGSIGTVNVTLGSFNRYAMYGVLLDNDVDGIVLNYNPGKWNIDIFAFSADSGNAWNTGKMYDLINANPPDTSVDHVKTYGAQIGYNFNDAFGAKFAYYRMESKLFDEANDVMELGVDYKFAKHANVWAEYINSDSVTDGTLKSAKNGWAAGVSYSTLDRSKPGTWELRASYMDVPELAAIAPTFELDITGFGDGYKGFNIGGSVMLAKNIDFNIDYFDFEGQHDSKTFGRVNDEQLLWTYVRFYF